MEVGGQIHGLEDTFRVYSAGTVNTVMRRLATGICSDKCVLRRFRR
jgi:hypothetical protein